MYQWKVVEKVLTNPVGVRVAAMPERIRCLNKTEYEVFREAHPLGKGREGALGRAEVKETPSKKDDDVVTAMHRGGQGGMGLKGTVGPFGCQVMESGLSSAGLVGLVLIYIEGQSGRSHTLDMSLWKQYRIDGPETPR